MSTRGDKNALHLLSGEYHVHRLPAGISGDFLIHKVLELFVQSRHELSTRCDTVGVKPSTNMSIWYIHIMTCGYV